MKKAPMIFCLALLLLSGCESPSTTQSTPNRAEIGSVDLPPDKTGIRMEAGRGEFNFIVNPYWINMIDGVDRRKFPKTKEKYFILEPGEHVFAVSWAESYLSAHALLRVKMESNKKYRVQAKRVPHYRTFWIEEVESGTAVTPEVTVDVANRPPLPIFIP